MDDEIMDECKEAIRIIDETLNDLRCRKCSNIPEGDVWELPLCAHRYCSSCFKTLDNGMIRTCFGCGTKSELCLVTEKNFGLTIGLQALKERRVEFNNKMLCMLYAEWDPTA